MSKKHEKASDIERAKALKAIRAVVSDEQFARISRELVSDEDASKLASKMAGLAEEDEFAVLCRLMKTVSHIVPLGQTPIIPGDSIPSDFLVRFQPGLWCENKGREQHSGFSCFVDVKSTANLKWRISGSLLKRRRNFAAAFGLPLLFAVRFTRFSGNAYWVIVHDDDWSKSRLDIAVEDLMSGLRHVLFNEYWYMLHPGIAFEGVFDAGLPSGGMRDKRYGSLTEFRIITRRNRLPLGGDQAVLWSAFFQAYRLEEVGATQTGGRSIVTYRPGVTSCSIIDLVYCFNCLATDETGGRIYDASRSVAHADIDPSARLLADREAIETGARTMEELGFLHLLGVGMPDQHALLWRKYGGM
jgi:hypothetical protein